MERRTNKIEISNSRKSGSQLVYVEPWGNDYTLHFGEKLEIIALGKQSTPWFHICESEGATSVYIEEEITSILSFPKWPSNSVRP